MQSFLILFGLVFSFQALAETSCQNQKKLLKKTCSFKKEKIKAKNTASLNSCKKIKDLFIDLKTKTKESYKLCQKAYETCSELCTTCNKSLVSKFKKKSEKNLKKIKKGFKKASKCVSQLSSDFEEKKDQSFNSQSYKKEFLKYLKQKERREAFERKKKHQEYLRKKKENKIIREKLAKTSKKVFESADLFNWARKNKLRTYGKNNEELKKMKVDYEIKQIKKEARIERLKLQEQRKEKLKKKFEAEILKANPPKTKLGMAFEAVKETFSSYWTKTKSFFGRVFLGEFASAQKTNQCEITKPTQKNMEAFDDLTKTDLATYCEGLIEDFTGHTNDVFDGDGHGKSLIQVLKKGFQILDLGIFLFNFWLAEKNPKIELCNYFRPELHKLKERAEKIKEIEVDDQFHQLLGSNDNNIYHLLSYFYEIHQISQNQTNVQIPDVIKGILDRYMNLVSIYDTKVSENLATVFIVRYLVTKGFGIYYANDYNYDLNSREYKPPLSIAIDQMLKATGKDNNRNFVIFYQRYIASLIKIAGARTREAILNNNYTIGLYTKTRGPKDKRKYVDSEFADVVKDKVQQETILSEYLYMIQNVEACFY